MYNNAIVIKILEADLGTLGTWLKYRIKRDKNNIKFAIS